MKLPSLKLNARGFSHHLIMILVVLGTAVGGTAYLVASHAQVPYSNVFSCPSQPTLSVKTGSSSPTCTKYAQYVVGGIAVDGSFGPVTQSAIRSFQYNNHVGNSGCTTAGPSSCDGIIGSATWSALVASNNKQTQASAAASAPRGTLTCTPISPNDVTLHVTYANAGAAGAKLYKASSLLTSYATASGNTNYTASRLVASTAYSFSLHSGAATLATATCTTGKLAATTTPPTTPHVTTPPTVTPPVPVTPTTPAPTTTAACATSAGSTYFYDGERCVTLIKPTCAVNTMLVTVPGTNVTYYCKAKAEATTNNPLISCTYYVGINEAKTTDSTHHKSFCENIHNQQITWKACPVVNRANKTVTEIHSVAYCAHYKPTTNTATIPKPAEPAKPKPIVINKPALCSTSQRAKPSVNFGERSNCVAYLQQQMKGVEIDGKFEGKTKDRVVEFQTNHNLVDTTGKNVGPCTWEAIYTQKFDADCQVTYSTTDFRLCTHFGDTPKPLHINTSSYECKNKYDGIIGPVVPGADGVSRANTGYVCAYYSSSFGSLTQTTTDKSACYKFRYSHSYGFCQLHTAVNVKNAGGTTFGLYTHQHCDQITESWGGVLADGR